MTVGNEPFSTSYNEARSKFLESADTAGAALHEVRHPNSGPAGEPLFIDFASLGPVEAQNALIVVSGTHGAEGYCGSGCQVDLLRSSGRLAAYGAFHLILVHAHNPWGFAWGRRVNEDNIDLNRNYIDYAGDYPMNEAYQEVADMMRPNMLNESTLSKLEAFLRAYGPGRLARLVAPGQRVDPKGLFFAGLGPAWSNRIMHQELPGLVIGNKRIVTIDIHTGLGPYGHGEILHEYTKGTQPYHSFNHWFEGEAVSIREGEFAATEGFKPDGDFVSMAAMNAMMPGKEHLSFAVEYGTVDMQQIIRALFADNWLFNHGDPLSPKGQAIRAELTACFHINEDKWHQMVLDRFHWILDRIAIIGTA